MPTIAHISDLHLQSGVPERQTQVEPILQKINESKPDLVVISGDVTDDGWDSIEELKWAKGWLDERIEARWFAVPGNHDVGNFADQPEGRIDQKRVEAWQQVFGISPTRAMGAWQIIGLNSMPLGSSLRAWGAELGGLALNLDASQTEGQHIALFLHTPLLIDRADEPAQDATTYWLGPADPRRELWPKIVDARVTLLGSGHVHQTRLTEVDGVKIAWAPPASGTWVHAPGLPNPPMPQRTGFFLHTLHDDGTVETELIECAPMLKLYEHNPWP